jgi:outer membrane protein TolC
MSKPEIRLPAAYEAGSGEGASTLSTQALDSWWALFDDPQLTELIGQALAVSPDAKSALAKLKESRAVYSKTVVGYLPQGDLSGRATLQHLSSTLLISAET